MRHLRRTMLRRLIGALGGATLVVLAVAGPTLACGGLIGPNGAVQLLRTTTLAGYHDGVEHYVTSFEFAGGTGEFGSIIPLPGVPTDVVKGGDWTLQRLIRETDPPREAFFALGASAAAAPDAAQVLLETKIDALEITVLKGGGDEVGLWARDHGFRLPPDAPEMLSYYASRSPIFLAARFDADAAKARGQQVGDGTPIHVIIPTQNPWVPLRILALGKTASEQVQADVYLLTDNVPTLLPGTTGGVRVTHSEAASDQLLTDLRTDRDMSWVPTAGWLTKVSIDGPAGDISGDLAIDASGQGVPSRLWAGLEPAGLILGMRPTDLAAMLLLVVIVIAGATMLGRMATPRAANPA